MAIEERLLNNVSYYNIKIGNNASFQELGNQSYGFTLPYVKERIDELSTEIRTRYSNYFKILVAHHPPNNWLHWEELYNLSSSSKSDFQNFIIDCGIDLILCGHEHLSLVEGGLLFGRSLILHGGMFLDHRERDYDNLWFKILELNGLNTPNYSINEKWFHYENHSGGVWKEQTQFSVKYKNWNSVCYRNKQEASSFERDGGTLPLKDLLDKVRPSEEDIFKNLLSMVQPSTDMNIIDSIKNLIFRKYKCVGKPPLRETQQYFYSKESNMKLVVIQNINDLFLDLKESWGRSDISYVLDNITNEDNDVYVFYLCKISHSTLENLTKAETLLESEFYRFSSFIANLERVNADKISKIQFAIRFES